MNGERVMMHVDTFVAVIACLAVAGATLSPILRALLVRADRVALQGLEQRISQLESQQR